MEMETTTSLKRPREDISPPASPSPLPKRELKEQDFTVFITSFNGTQSLYGHCLKPRVNIHHIISSHIKGTPQDIILSKKYKYVKIICKTQTQKNRLMELNEISGLPEPYSVTGNYPENKILAELDRFPPGLLCRFCPLYAKYACVSCSSPEHLLRVT